MVVGFEEKLATFATIYIRALFYQRDVFVDVEGFEHIDVCLLGYQFCK